MSDVISVKREDLAKFMALCQQTILSLVTKQALSKEKLKETFDVHMEPGFIEGALQGIGQDFDMYQVHGDESASNTDLVTAIQEIAEEMEMYKALEEGEDENE